MTQKKKNFSGILLYLVQGLFLCIGLVSAVISLCGAGTLSGSAFLPTVMYAAAYLFLLLFAFWGYKRSVVPFHLSLWLVTGAVLVLVVRLLEGLVPMAGGMKAAVLIVCTLFILLLLVFDNSFKKHKNAALISGSLSVLCSMVLPVLLTVNAIVSGLSGSELSALQPLAPFFISGILVSTYAARCKWSAEGKEGNLFFL